ncbi:tyrosine-protein kinase Fer-like [Planoprotostelium fungivorum]|uniref:Tyrosine-protein kinase Fer-like n=1 Tax=Planoprotostelium fungivorum TaxID=1890364 RepID=A0A2P6MUH7_9EUKA|nr:tyrosine-protein kinase Fer-like [Planoprotostelium fungivorum]
MLETSLLGSVLTSISFCLLFVNSLYLWNIHFIKALFNDPNVDESHRDHPRNIRKRFISVAFTCTTVLCYMRFIVWTPTSTSSSFLEEIGIRWPGLLVAIILPLLLVMLLFLGPLSLRFFEHDWDDLFQPGEITWWRNIVVGPVSEELVFRGCMTPLLLAGGFSPATTVFLSPFIFGLAHAHHILNHLHTRGVQWRRAILQTIFQLAYTTIFGAFETFLFIRTNHVMGAIMVHMFCNFMGFPDIGSAKEHQKKNVIGFCYVGGLMCFIFFLYPMTQPWLYSNSVEMLLILVAINELEHVHFPLSLARSICELPSLHICTKSYIQLTQVQRNNLNGTIPVEPFKRLQSLKYINLSRNQLRGNIPIILFDLPHLIEMDLSDNSLNGSLLLSHRKRTGPLETLNLSQNQLSGDLPDLFTRFPNMSQLFMRHNDFTGNIPRSLSKLKHLLHIDLSNNHLIGSVPVASSPHVSTVNMANNLITGYVVYIDTHSQLNHLNLSGNRMSGTIRAASSNTLTSLDLSRNNLSTLPQATISSFLQLRHLNLSRNRLERSDLDLSPMQHIQHIDLSHNRLRGEIIVRRDLPPEHLDTRFNPDHVILDVSYNYDNGTVTVVDGISGDGTNRNVLIGVLVPSAIIFLLILPITLYLVWRRWMRRILRKHDSYGDNEHGEAASSVDVIMPEEEEEESLEMEEEDRDYLSLSIDNAKDVKVPRSILLSGVVVSNTKIGRGNFGAVYRGDWNGTPVALKKLNDRDKYEECIKEFSVLQKLNHPHVVRLFGLCQYDRYILMVLELCPLGSVRDFLRESPDVTEEDLISMCIDVAAGMWYLELKGVLHRDLGARNLLIAETAGQYWVKIADFGLSKEADYYKSQSGIMAYKWCAPEILQYGRSTYKSDVWSYGVCLWEIFSRGQEPYQGMANAEAVKQVCKGYRLERPQQCPVIIYRLMMRCWQHNSYERPGFKEIYDELRLLSANDEIEPNDSSSVITEKPRYPPLVNHGAIMEGEDDDDEQDDNYYNMTDAGVEEHGLLDEANETTPALLSFTREFHVPYNEPPQAPLDCLCIYNSIGVSPTTDFISRRLYYSSSLLGPDIGSISAMPAAEGVSKKNFETLRRLQENASRGFPLAYFTDILITILQTQKVLLEASYDAGSLDQDRRLDCLERVRDMTQITVLLEQFMTKTSSQFESAKEPILSQWRSLSSAFNALKENLVFFIKIVKEIFLNELDPEDENSLTMASKAITSSLRSTIHAAEALDGMISSSTPAPTPSASASNRPPPRRPPPRDVTKGFNRPQPAPPKDAQPESPPKTEPQSAEDTSPSTDRHLQRKDSWANPRPPSVKTLRSMLLATQSLDIPAQTKPEIRSLSAPDLNQSPSLLNTSGTLSASPSGGSPVGSPYKMTGTVGSNPPSPVTDKKNKKKDKTLEFNTLLRNMKKGSKSPIFSECEQQIQDLSSHIGKLMEILETTREAKKMKELKNSCESVLHSLKKIAVELSMQKEQERLDAIVKDFIRACVEYREEKIPDPSEMCLLLRSKLATDDSLWWFDRLMGAKRKEANFKEQEALLSRREDAINYREQKLENEMMGLAKMLEMKEGGTLTKKERANMLSNSAAFGLMNGSLDMPRTSDRYLLQVGLPLHGVIKTVTVSGTETGTELLERLILKYYRTYAPDAKAVDYMLKIPGQQIIIDPSMPFHRVDYIQRFRKQEDPLFRVELLLLERETNRMPSSTQQIIQKAEQKANSHLLRQEDGRSIFNGPVLQQMSIYKLEMDKILRSLARDYGVDFTVVETFERDEKFDADKQLRLLKKMLTENSHHNHKSQAELTRLINVSGEIDTIVETLFDEYEGIRQIKDLRGLPNLGETIIVDGTQTNNRISRVISIIQIILFEKSMGEHCDYKRTHYVPITKTTHTAPLTALTSQPFSTRSEDILKAFSSLKRGILREVNMLSSLQEKSNENTAVNCAAAKNLSTAYLEIVDEFVRETMKAFEEKIAQTAHLSEEKQERVYAGFQGPIQLEFEAARQFAEIRSWVNNLIEIQVVSMIQREVFATTRPELDEIMRQNNQRMIRGFQGMLEQAVPAAVICLQELLQYIEDYIRSDRK